ncbi:MAG: DNA polymerase [Casimicrobium sp.]
MAEDLFFFDTETFSETPIQRGTHAYAVGAEIMVCSWAFGMTEKAKVADLTNDFGIGTMPFPDEVLDALNTPWVQIVGANFGNFDRNLLRYARGIVIDPARIIDTQVQALSHGLPGGLDKLGEIFNVADGDAKIKEGKSLIQLFCKPRPKNMDVRRATKRTHPIEWQRFLEYARVDIPAMRHVYKHAPKWNYPGTGSGNQLAPERALWCLDQKINDRGFAVDRELASAAVAAVNKAQKTLNSRTADITTGDVEKASQRDRLLKHLLAEWGVELPDMTKSTLERRVNDETLPDAVRELLAIRLEASATSTSKYTALLNGVSEDGRLRGTMQFCGASRTGRWAGRIFQPQNLPRPNMKSAEIAVGIDALKQGTAHLLYDNPIALASNAIRGSIVAERGNKLVIADLSNIEGRVAAWLAGEKWKLQAFKDYDAGTGPDLYIVGAANVLSKPVDQITGDERQSSGKVPELACGYGGALGAFNSMALLYGLHLSDAEVRRIVDGWRDANQKIVQYWDKLQTAMWLATTEGGEHRAGRIGFDRKGAWVRMRLPSGRFLCYADAKIIPDPRWKGRQALSYMGLNSYTRKWERLTTYGGKIFENACQAVARDVLANGMILCEDNGYPIVLDIHDEIIAETLDNDNYSVKTMAGYMSRVPDWADNDLPLSAAGFETYRYRKG